MVRDVTQRKKRQRADHGSLRGIGIPHGSLRPLTSRTFIAGFDALSLLDGGMIVLGVEAATLGAFFIAKPETMVRFYRRFNETRPVYRRMMSPPPIDVRAARSMGV